MCPYKDFNSNNELECNGGMNQSIKKRNTETPQFDINFALNSSNF